MTQTLSCNLLVQESAVSDMGCPRQRGAGLVSSRAPQPFGDLLEELKVKLLAEKEKQRTSQFPSQLR